MSHFEGTEDFGGTDYPIDYPIDRFSGGITYKEGMMKVKVEPPQPDNPLGITAWAQHYPFTDTLTKTSEPDGHTPADNVIDKDTNPKDVIAANKLPLSLVPDTMVIYATLAFLEGALKYGRYNWRIAGVRSSIYLDALKRHLADYENGEDCDPKTGVPHLANALACLGIIIDAKVCGKLNDDRPPVAPIGDLIRSMDAEVVRLKDLFTSHHPHQYTIADSPKETR